MRVFGLFFKYIVMIVVVGALVYAAAPHLLLAFATRTLKKETAVFADRARNLPSYSKLCKAAPAASDLSEPVALQVRFKDARSYAVEIVCSYTQDAPVEISDGTLPPFVTKTAGTSGFYMDIESPQPSAIELTSLYGKKTLSFDGEKLSQIATLPLAAQDKPVTVCAGYGYQCCSSGIHKGTGASQAAASDCAAECFQTCQPLPYIQAFSAEPYPENQEIVMPLDSVDVTFTFGADHSKGKIAKVTIDYGDGASDTSTEMSGYFTHTFTCATACRIPVKITAVDEKGISSVENDSTTLYIVRR